MLGRTFKIVKEYKTEKSKRKASDWNRRPGKYGTSAFCLRYVVSVYREDRRTIYNSHYPLGLFSSKQFKTIDFENTTIENQIVEGELLVKGRITVFKALKMALVVFFNKDVRRLIKLLKREAV